MKTITIITGASSGIGCEFAKTLEKNLQCDELWAIARNKSRLEALSSALSIPVKCISMDLGDPGAKAQLQSLLEEEKPQVKLLINASGYGKFNAFTDEPLEDNLGMIDLNCTALTAVTYLCLPYMTEGSKIVNIASVAAFQPIPYINIYGATKAYVLSFSRALNRELKRRGIHVMAVCPFWTRTRFFDRAITEGKEPVVKKYAAMYEPEYIAAYSWKALKKGREYCIPGLIAKYQVLLVKILPHNLVETIWMKQQKLS